MGISIHPSAIVDEGAVLGDGCRVWHFVHISAGARIGRGCSFGQNVYVGNDVHIGNGVKIQNNVSVYDAVTLEDEVFCGPSMVFTNVFNPRAAVARKDEYRRTLVKRGATLGANCTVVCGVTVGQHALLGVPARQAGWMSRFGERLELPLRGEGEAVCRHTGDRYRLSGHRLQLEA
jgi:UDP-2-acetamido-3-amino-2,3-dideoxy-glucuronate N-acetyltransferase